MVTDVPVADVLVADVPVAEVVVEVLQAAYTVHEHSGSKQSLCFQLQLRRSSHARM